MQHEEALQSIYKRMKVNSLPCVDEYIVAKVFRGLSDLANILYQAIG